MRYNIFNPTTARRIIYDGIEGSQRKIQIGPLETKTDVELADHIAAGFTDGKDGDKSDLWVTPLVGGYHPDVLAAADKSFVSSLSPDTHAYQTEYPTAMKPSEEPAPMPPPPATLPEGYARYQAPPIEEKAKKQRKKQDG